MKKRSFIIKGMRCAGCAAGLQKKIGRLEGVSEVYVNFASGMMTLSAAERIPDAFICEAVAKAGFSAETEKTESFFQRQEESPDTSFASLVSALAFSILLFYAAMAPMLHLPFPELSGPVEGLLQIVLLIPVLTAGRRFYIFGFKALFSFTPNMDSLIAVSTSCALLYSLVLFALHAPERHFHYYFDSAAMIVALILLGKYLESLSRKNASSAIRGLMDLAPEKALRMEKDGRETIIPVQEVKINDLLRVLPGARIPADGIVAEGSGFTDESMLTGESIPVEKKSGDVVRSGTLNVNGSFLFRTTGIGKDTTLARIVEMVRLSQGYRPEIARLADLVSGFFVWGIFAAALLTFLIWYLPGFADLSKSLEFACSVMVIACPCALGLATPISLIAGIGTAAKLGILIRNGNALEKIVKADTVFLDKTGTLTEGRPALSGILVFQKNISEEELLRLAASAERSSEHPLAKAIVSAAKDMEYLPVADFRNEPGRGIRCRIGEKTYIFGTERYLAECDIFFPENPVPEGFSRIYAASEGTLLGCFLISDPIRPESKKAVSALKKLHLKTVMLTGDRKDTAERIAGELELDSCHAELLPEDKLSLISEAQKKSSIVVMAGDGINDAPSLVRADVGISVGSGTDIAMESADIILTGRSLEKLPLAFRLGKKVMKTIRQNLFWAFFYNILCIPAAAGCFSFAGIRLNPVLCALAMSLSSVTVVLNALRLRSFKH